MLFAVRAFDCPVPLKLPPFAQFADVVQVAGAPPECPHARVLLAPFTIGDVAVRAAVTGGTQIVPLEAVPLTHTPVAVAVADATCEPFALRL